jgi:hypothetical protein
MIHLPIFALTMRLTYFFKSVLTALAPRFETRTPIGLRAVLRLA